MLSQTFSREGVWDCRGCPAIVLPDLPRLLAESLQPGLYTIASCLLQEFASRLVLKRAGGVKSGMIMTDSWKILEGDCLTMLRTLPANLFHACVTSPPYFALRDYKCPGQIGLEKSPAAFIGKLVDVFEEVRRVMRDDGVLWLNCGDSYASGKGSCFNPGGGETSMGKERKAAGTHPLHRGNVSDLKRNGMKPLDLMMIPARLALALQAAGWYLRSSIVWRKAAPMPESVSGTRWERCRVKASGEWSNSEHNGFDDGHSGHISNRAAAAWSDCPGCKRCLPNDGLVLRRGSWRCTRAYEYIFMLTKTADYYADGFGVRQTAVRPGDVQTFGGQKGRDYEPDEDDPNFRNGNHQAGRTVATGENGANLRDVWQFPLESLSKDELIDLIRSSGDGNQSDVWDISPEPLSLPHYAAFPSELPYRCLKASTSAHGVCAECGAPWARVVEVERTKESGSGRSGILPVGKNGQLQGGGETGDVRNGPCVDVQTLGWRPTCTHAAPCVPALCLDPFSGAGTTVMAARRLGLRAVGIELNPTYAAMARERIVDDSPLFNVGAG